MQNADPTPKHELHLSNVLLSVLSFIAVISALKASYSVTMPLAFALFIIILAWPLMKWLRARVPHKLAYPLTLLALLGIFGIFVGLLAYSTKQMVDAAPKYSKQATQMWQRARQQAATQGVKLPENPRDMLFGSSGGSSEAESSGSSESGDAGGSSSEGSSSESAGSSSDGSRRGSSSGGSSSSSSASGGSSGGSGSGRGTSVVKFLFSMTGLWLLVFGLVVLGLHEAPKFSEKLHRGEGPEKSNDLVPVIEKVIDKCGRYFMVRSVVSGIQGVCSYGVALLLGLDLAFIWGLTAALLNYIPTVGSLISVIPPTLFALFQFQDPGRAAIVFFAMCAVQITLGTFVDPLLEGRQLQISSFLVLFSIAFWGWVWGVAGALIGVPLTVTILLFCAHFPGTKWISDMLTEGGEENGKNDAEQQAGSD